MLDVRLSAFDLAVGKTMEVAMPADAVWIIGSAQN